MSNYHIRKLVYKIKIPQDNSYSDVSLAVHCTYRESQMEFLKQ